MRVLTVSRGNLEIARAHLRKPMLTIGRAPSCDVILRAPGVDAIHFLVEWIGGGAFDPDQGAWAIVDVSTAASRSDRPDSDESGEGVVLSDGPALIGDFVFECIQDQFESSEVIGGQIAQSLSRAVSGAPEVLELVQVRVDSGAVEAVSHYPVPAKAQKRGKKERIVPSVREFKIEWTGVGCEAVLNLLLEEMPGAEVFSRGQRIQAGQGAVLKPNDLVQVRWRGQDFYLRFVEQVISPPVPHDFWGDPLLRKLAFGIGIAGLFLMAVLRFIPAESPSAPPPPRVARIEVLEAPAKPVEPPPVPPPPAPDTEQVQKKPEERIEPSVQKAPLKAQDAPKKQGKAAAPRVVSQPAEKPRAGLNSPAKVTDVNAVGLLGALNKSAARGTGVRADKIINEGIVTEATTGLESSKVVLKSSPAGVVGTGSGGSLSGGKGLGEASTTLKGAGKYDPSSVGPIARKGGASGFSVGSSISGTGAGIGKGNELGTVDGGDFSVEGGGLDRETVRRVIQSRRGEVRTCYERALLTQSSLEGRIVYTWRISSDGSVISVEVSRSNLDAPGLRACVLEVIRKIQFPKAPNGKATKVIYPFVFQGRR